MTVTLHEHNTAGLNSPDPPEKPLATVLTKHGTLMVGCDGLISVKDLCHSGAPVSDVSSSSVFTVGD